MKSFHVEITETLRKVVTVKARTHEEAIDIVRNSWRNSEYVLDADDFLEAGFEVVGSSR